MLLLKRFWGETGLQIIDCLCVNTLDFTNRVEMALQFGKTFDHVASGLAGEHVVNCLFALPGNL